MNELEVFAERPASSIIHCTTQCGYQLLHDNDSNDINSFSDYLRVVFMFVLRLFACIIPKTTAANELWCDVCRESDAACAWGTPAGMGPGDVT